MVTGYFCVIDKPRTKVHIVERGKPLCGSKVKGEFLWCARGVQIEYIECKSCLRIYCGRIKKAVDNRYAELVSEEVWR